MDETEKSNLIFMMLVFADNIQTKLRLIDLEKKSDEEKVNEIVYFINSYSRVLGPALGITRQDFVARAIEILKNASDAEVTESVSRLLN